MGRMAGITTKKPKIERVEPAAGIAGGEIGIHGRVRISTSMLLPSDCLCPVHARLA